MRPSAVEQRGTSVSKPGEGGFTLVEVLVVVVILGLLAAIAIPVFTGQQRRAADAAVKSDLRVVAGVITALHTADVLLTRETVFTEGLELTEGTDMTVHAAPDDGLCVAAWSTKGAGSSQTWVYLLPGGLLGSEVASCAGAELFGLP